MLKQKTSYLTVGVVLDVLAGPRSYLVNIGQDAPVPCSDGASSGNLTNYGPTKIGMYLPGSIVLVYVDTAAEAQPDDTVRDVRSGTGIIICAVPGIVSSKSDRIMDWVTPFTGADAMNNLAHSSATKIYAGQYYDYNLNRPMDAVPGSDEGLMNELGVGHGISRFFSWMSASDIAGIWCFYLDNLTRIAAHNYEFWCAGGERNIKDEEGEINDVEVFTPYPWEALGVSNPGLAALQTQADGGVWRPGQKKLWVEPTSVDQEIIPRQIIFRGYLGDLHREMIVVPKLDAETSETFINTRSSTEDFTGVLDIQKGMNGSYSVRSAKSIHHEKYIFLPLPKRKQLPEQTDDLGDGITNYKPSGVYGDGPTVLHSKYEWEWSDPSRPDMWLAEMYDAHAYMFNWYNMQPILAHVKDYFVPDEGVFPTTEAEQDEEDPQPIADARGTYSPDARLSDTFMFPLPDFSEIAVDQRIGTSKFYFTRSIISQLDDGSILIEDGYGSTIHMTGGNIFTSAAGDIWQRPGRCAVTWAGDDIVQKAGSSVDISASNGDLRLKAEKNLHMIGGNSGVTGGIIVESRSVYGIGDEFKFRDGDVPIVGEDVVTYGIIFKSMESPLMMYSKNVYVRGAKTLTGVGGDVIIEADNDLTESAAQDITRLTATGLTDIIGQTLADGANISGSSIVNRFDKENTVINSTNIFRAAAQYVLLDTVDGAIYSGGTLGIAHGVVAYPSATITNLITNWSADFTSWLTGTGDYDLPVILANTSTLVYGGGIMGATDFIDQVGFTCRNEAQYGLSDDFWIVEARWQQMYRSKDIGLLWYEPSVKIPGLTDTDVTRPHPGNNYWLYYDKFAEYDPELWQWEGGYNAARDVDLEAVADGEDVSIYDTVRKERANGDSEAFKMRILADSYMVSRQIAGPELPTTSSTPQ